MTYHFVCIGTGGTGSILLTRLGQYLASNSTLSYTLSVFDGDIIERKNLSRQVFSECDIGQNKASAMICALEEVYGISATAYPMYITTEEDITSRLPIEHADAILVLLGCVDNHHCRAILEAVYHKRSNCVYIDSANDWNDGEIVTACRLKGVEVAPPREHYFPGYTVGEKAVTELSCTELNAVAPQHINTNNFAATLVFSIIVSMVDDHKIQGGITFFSVPKLVVQHIPFEPNDHA